MYIVSDYRNGAFKVVAKFSGPKAKESAERYAKATSKVNRLRSLDRFKSLYLGQKLPARYM
jgi:hypothetical protein